MFCKNCGYVIKDNSPFCPACGTQVSPLEAEFVDFSNNSHAEASSAQPAPEKTAEQPEYTGEKAPLLLRIWMFYMIFSFVITAIGSLSVAQTFSEALLLISLPFVCYLVPLVFALLRFDSVRFLFAGMVSAVIWNALTNDDFASVSTFFGLSLVFFAVYIFFSKKVRVYLSRKKTFSLPKLKVSFSVILAVLFALVAAWALFSLNTQLHAVASLDSRITELEEKLNTANYNNERLSEMLAEEREAVAWYEDNIAFIEDAINPCAYHKKDCPLLDHQDFCLNITALELVGYWPCVHCQ